MCTLARRLRRGTPEGITRKLRKRGVTTQIKNLRASMGKLKPHEDCTGFIQAIAQLSRLRRAI